MNRSFFQQFGLIFFLALPNEASAVLPAEQLDDRRKVARAVAGPIVQREQLRRLRRQWRHSAQFKRCFLRELQILEHQR
jgi:hypothetical protein